MGNMTQLFSCLIWVLTSMLIGGLFLSLSSLFLESEKSSYSDVPFECGMESPSSLFRVPFCLHFFVVVVIFLIFDIEFIICIPSIFVVESKKIAFSFWTLIFLILVVGLFIEVFLGSLDWKE
nr:NADH dehydrogenase subunit 3 [Chelopistes texanus]